MNNTSLAIDKLHALDSLNIHKNYDLSDSNTMALSCQTSGAVILTNEAEIDRLFTSVKQLQEQPRLFILSGGSNVILPKHLDALSVLPQYTGINILKEDDKSIEIEVMAGNNWHNLVVQTVNNGWFGLENLALIPGLVGAAPVQNIGAYGRQLEDFLTQVHAYHIPTGQWHKLSKAECQFAYRDSIFKKQPNTWLISRVAFRLHKDTTATHANYGDVQQHANDIAKKANRNNITPSDVLTAIINIRQAKLPDPKILPNCGSFFQNPIIKKTAYEKLLHTYPDMPHYPIDADLVKVPAGWLIDKAGLKGKGIAPILTHKNQALVLTNHQPLIASQADIANTRDFIIETVNRKFAITLNPEPVWVE